MLKAQVEAVAANKSRTLLKTIRDGAAPVSVLIRRGSRASAEDRTKPQLQVTDHADPPRTHVHRLGKRVGRNAANRPHLASEGSPVRNRGSSAAPKCSNQTDLHLTLTDPLHSSDLPQRPSLTSMRLVCIENVRARQGLLFLNGTHGSGPGQVAPERPRARNGARQVLRWHTALQGRHPLRYPAPETL